MQKSFALKLAKIASDHLPVVVDLIIKKISVPESKQLIISFIFISRKISMGQKLITACTYTTVMQAEVAKIALAQAGIQSFVNDSFIASTHMFGFNNHVDGVKLDIDEQDAEAAWEVLSKDDRLMGKNVSAGDLDENACLSCNAPMNEEEIVCSKCGWTFAIERNSTNSEEDSEADNNEPN